MSESSILDFKPRARSLLLGGIPWLARIADKARASMAGRLGDYIYPCPADQHFLEEVQMSAEDFSRLVAGSPDDGELVARMQEHLAKNRRP